MNTPLDNFRGAALSLARSGSIKDRLTAAYRNHLAFIDESELPVELVEEFRAVSCALSRERPLLRGEDSFRATVRKMSSIEADEVASTVVRLFGEMSREPASSVARKPPKSLPQIISLYPAAGGEAWTVVDRAG
jgi:hypothetical protein